MRKNKHKKLPITIKRKKQPRSTCWKISSMQESHPSSSPTGTKHHKMQRQVNKFTLQKNWEEERTSVENCSEQHLNIKIFRSLHLN